jgi:hypothetical protein
MPDLDCFLSACPKNGQYLSWKIQNEIIQLIDNSVVQEVIKPIVYKKKPFSVIMDETTDGSTKLQVAICIRLTDEETGIPQEHLVAMVEASNSTGEALAQKLLDVLSELGLSLEQLVGQGYDGGSNMRGDIQGVQKRILEKCPRAVYTWCWSHNLQLVMSHASEESAPATECFSKMKEVYSCVSSSAKRTAILQRHLLGSNMPTNEDDEAEVNPVVDKSDSPISDESPNAREARYRRLLSISGTRFIARTRNLRIFHTKHSAIRDALFEMGLPGIAKSLNNRFQATVSILYKIMCPISELSQALQSPEFTLLDAHQQLILLSNNIKALRTEEMFFNLTNCQQSANPEGTEKRPSKRQKVNLPTRLLDSIVTENLPQYSVRWQKTLLLSEYFEILDIIENQISIRFRNPSLLAVAALQTGKMTEALGEFCTLHGKDPEEVARQLEFVIIGLEGKTGTLQDLFTASKVQRDLHYMLDVALALPVTTASAERAFSRLRLIKSHLRTTMSEYRLQSLVRISSNRSTASQICLTRVLNDFTLTERRILFK